MEKPVEGSGITPSYSPLPSDIQQKPGAMQLPEGKTVKASRDFLGELRVLAEQVQSVEQPQMEKSLIVTEREALNLASETDIRLRNLKQKVQKSRRGFLSGMTKLLGKRTPESLKKAVEQDDRNECNRIFNRMVKEGLIKEYDPNMSFNEKKTFLDQKISQLQKTTDELYNAHMHSLSQTQPTTVPRPAPQTQPPIAQKKQEEQPKVESRARTPAEVKDEDDRAVELIKSGLFSSHNPFEDNYAFTQILNSNDKGRIQAFQKKLLELLKNAQNRANAPEDWIQKGAIKQKGWIQGALNQINAKLMVEPQAPPPTEQRPEPQAPPPIGQKEQKETPKETPPAWKAEDDRAVELIKSGLFSSHNPFEDNYAFTQILNSNDKGRIQAFQKKLLELLENTKKRANAPESWIRAEAIKQRDWIQGAIDRINEKLKGM